MPLLRRRIRCYYCNEQSRDSVSRMPSQYFCPHCEAVNHFDERGNITDPPAETLAVPQMTSFQHVPSRSPSPVMTAPDQEFFCDTCQRNQTMVQRLKAEYLPDEDDPSYEKFEAAYDEYLEELEERYPQVCNNCRDRVNDQIRNTGYAAKADHLRRIMEKSEQKRRTVQTSRQAWTLKIITLAKCIYVLSFSVQVLWHVFGYMMVPDEDVWDDEIMSPKESFSWDICLSQAFHVRSVDESCVLSTFVTNLVQSALVADFITIWWNPRLKDKTNSLAGRMHGLKSLWAIRVVTLILRTLSFYFLQSKLAYRGTPVVFYKIHLFMIVFMAFSLLLTWNTVRIIYNPPAALRQPAMEPVSTPNSAQKTPRSTYKPAHPQTTAFDTMAHGFSSSFQEDDDASALPPSPTLTASSYTTHATDATTPFGLRSTRGDDDMDWTPSQRRFAAVQPAVHPSPWGQQSRSPSPTPQTKSYEPHSLFSQPDPNPFRHRIPAAPKAPAQTKADPWKRGVWDPPLKETTPNFFKEDQKARGGVGETKGLDGFGVPRNVKRDAELFASPKLKYDYYGTMKDTGLEDTFESTFNNLFAK